MTKALGNDKNWRKIEDNPDYEAWERIGVNPKGIEVNPRDTVKSSDDSQEWIHNYNKSKYSKRCPHCGKIINNCIKDIKHARRKIKTKENKK